MIPQADALHFTQMGSHTDRASSKAKALALRQNKVKGANTEELKSFPKKLLPCNYAWVYTRTNTPAPSDL